MKCADLSERVLLDFVYGRTAEPERKRIEEHLVECASCRARAAEVGLVLHALDAVEADDKGTSIIELHGDGTATHFLFGTWCNGAQARRTLDAGGNIESISAVLVNGEEAAIEPIPGQESRKARLRLVRPIGPGGRVELLMVGAQRVPEEGDKDIGGGVREFGPGKLLFDTETLFEMAVRLPQRARLEKATPDPHEVRTNGATTVIWRKVHRPNEEFEFRVEYRP